MGGWTFAQGKAQEKTLGDVVTAGAKQIALAGADGIFAVNDLLFISEGDGTETEYLGAVTAVSATDVDFTLAVRQSKNSGGKLWRAAASHVTGGEVVSPLIERVKPGVAIERSLDGTVYAIETGEAESVLDFGLGDQSPGQGKALLTWLDTNGQRGLNAFTLISPAREVRAVRQGAGNLEQRALAGGHHALAFELLIEAEGEYR